MLHSTTLLSPLLHETLKSIATRHSYYVRCYTAIFLQNLKLFIKSPNTILVTIYKSPILFWVTIYKKPKYYFANSYKSTILFWQLFTKSPILFWQLLQRGQYNFGNFYKKPNTILASSIKKTQNYWTNNYSTKAQILFGKRIILWSKPKTILWKKHILIY